MPVVRFRDRIPGPVRRFEILKDDARVLVLFRRVAPDVELPLRRTRQCAARFLEPRILIRRMIDHEFGDDTKAALMRCLKKSTEIVECAVIWINIKIIGNVIAIITQWRWIKRQEPNGSDAQLLQIIELLNQTAKIPNAVTVAIMKSLNMQLIDDRVLVPKRIGRRCSRLG